MKSRKRKVLIIDEQPLFRSGVKDLLIQHGLSVVGESDNGSEALVLAERLEPDFVIMDILTPQLDAQRIVKRLSGSPQTKFIVLTSEPQKYYSQYCLDIGVSGFVTKTCPPDTLIEAMIAAIKGNCYFPYATRHAGEAASGHDRIALLSPRELIVCSKLAQGLDNKRIASEMLLSNKTISTYKTRIFEKLHVSSVVELAEISRSHGLV